MKKVILFLILILIVAIMLVAGFFIWPVYNENSVIKIKNRALEEELEAAKGEVTKLNKKVYDLEYSPEAIEDVARRKYGFCKEGEVILKIK